MLWPEISRRCPSVARVEPQRLSPRRRGRADRARPARDAERVFELTARQSVPRGRAARERGRRSRRRTIREATLARASRLSPPARGRRSRRRPRSAGESRLRSCARVSRAPLAAIEECLDCGILVDDGRALSFRHELIRRAVESATPATRAEALHAAVVDALEARAGSARSRADRPSRRARRPRRRRRAPRRRWPRERALGDGAPHEAAASVELALAHAGGASPARARGTAHRLGHGALARRPRMSSEAAERLREAAGAVRASSAMPSGRGARSATWRRAYWILARWEDAEQRGRTRRWPCSSAPATSSELRARAGLAGPTLFARAPRRGGAAARSSPRAREAARQRALPEAAAGHRHQRRAGRGHGRRSRRRRRPSSAHSRRRGAAATCTSRSVHS